MQSRASPRDEYGEFFKQIAEDSFIDISHLGRWRLSSSKGDFGLGCLLAHDPTSYWQSDGELPHFVEIQFSKLVEVSMIGMFTDLNMDESYTPQTVNIYAGFGRHDLVIVSSFDLHDAEGWSYMAVDRQGPLRDKPVKCRFLRIEIAKNHQNGKDTHVRGLRIVGPRPKGFTESSMSLQIKRL